MSTSQPNRHPAGVPTGGQFAPKAAAEADLSLVEPDPSEPDSGWDEMNQELFEANQKRRGMYDNHDLVFNEFPGPPAGAPSTEEWAQVGVTDPEQAKRLWQQHGVAPEDFSSDDRGTRMCACDLRGDMIFEGQLLSGATVLSRHAPDLDDHRVFHWQPEVYVNGERTSWQTLPAEDQLSYIRGYALAASQADHPEHLGARGHRPGEDDRMAWAGYVRGINAIHAAQSIEEGRMGDNSLAIVEPLAPNRRLMIRHARPDPVRRGYRAEIAPGQHRRHEHDEGVSWVPWSEEAKVFFTVDALGAD